MQQVIYYKTKNNLATRDPLRTLTMEDQEYVKRVMQCYLDLAQCDPRPEFATWFNLPNSSLPTQRQQDNQANSAATWALGIIEKLSRSPNRRDLSPSQCKGIEILSQQIAECYPWDPIPAIIFKDIGLAKLPATLDTRRQIFYEVGHK